MTVCGSQAGGGEGAAFCACPGPGGRTEPEPRCRDRDGTSCVYSTKAFYSFKNQPLGLFCRYKKKWGGGQGFCHSALMLINVLSLGPPGRGHLEHTFNNVGLEAQGLGDILALCSPPTCSRPPCGIATQRASWGPQVPLQLSATRGRTHTPSDPFP